MRSYPSSAVDEQLEPERRLEPSERRTGRIELLWRVRELALLVVAGLIFAVFAIFARHFLDQENLLGLARQTVVLLVIAVGMTFLLVGGELDLSVGANLAVSSIVLGILVAYHGWNPFAAAAVALLVGGFIGLVNGVGVVATGIPSLIFTLAMLFILRSVALLMTGALPVNFEEESTFTRITGGYVGQVSVQLFWGAGIAVLGGILLARTKFGSHVYATGGNRKAAERAGIRTARVKVTCFVIAGVLSAFAAILVVGLTQSGNVNNGSGYELTAIAAVVIGGTNLFGGSGSVAGTVIGAVILTMLSNGLIMMGVSIYSEQLVTGLIIILAVLIDIQLRKRVLKWSS